MQSFFLHQMYFCKFFGICIPTKTKLYHSAEIKFKHKTKKCDKNRIGGELLSEVMYSENMSPES